MTPELPLTVVEVDLGMSAAPPAVDRAARGACILFRWNGRPVGHSVVPATRGALDQGAWRAAVAQCERMLRRARVTERLERRYALQLGHALLHPSVTVAICTRDRTPDLARALTSLLAQDYAGPLEIVVVDNAPATDATARLCQTRFPTVRYVREPRPGLDWARNRAIAESHGEIVAFTDDDCVADPHWVTAIATPFASDPLLGCVTGLVFPLELETEAQYLFEAYGGFNRGYLRRWFRMDPRTGRRIGRWWGGTGQFGTGANMAFRRSLFETLGGFDPALDVGTATQGAGDLEMYFRVLKAGYGLVYEPAALIRHGHRRDMDVLHRQLATWGSGMGAYLFTCWRRYPDEHRGMMWVGMWLTQHWATRLARTLLQLEPYPPSLVGGEIAMAIASPWRYAQARRDAAAIAKDQGDLELRVPGSDERQALARLHDAVRSVAVPAADGVARLELTAPLPPALAAAPGAAVRVVALRHGEPVGHADLPAGSGPWSALQLSDALADAVLWQGGYAPDVLKALEATADRDERTTPRVPPAPWPDALPDGVSASICIATRDRPDDLRRCLTQLCGMSHARPVEIVVVDNNPHSGLTPPVVGEFPGVRLVSEARAGLSYARNAGFAACRGDIIAVTDDDVVVGEEWLERLLAPFAREDVQLVTGNVLPLELTTESQWRFEEYGGLGRGYFPWRADSGWLRQTRRYAARTWELGAAANHAVRSSWLRHRSIGPLDPRLGAGTPSGVGEDTDLFYRTLRAGGAIAYEPRSFVWHRHRDTMSGLIKQLRDYSSGHVGYHLLVWRKYGDRRGLTHLALDVSRWQLRRVWDRLLRRNDYPWSLIGAEVRGFLAGPWDFARSRRHVRRHGAATPFPPRERRDVTDREGGPAESNA